MQNKHLYIIPLLISTIIVLSACRKNANIISSDTATASEITVSVTLTESETGGTSKAGSASKAESKKTDNSSSSVPSAVAKTENKENVKSSENTVATEPQTDTAAVFSEKSAATSVGEIKYCLYTPKNPQKNMPLIIYLHGGTSKGDDLSKLTEIDGFPQYLKSGVLGDVRAYVIMPQLASDKKGWTDISAGIREIIGKAAENYGIDKTKVSLTGHSMGGTGTWGLALANTDLFWKIAPLSGSITLNEQNVNALKNISVRAFVGANDTIVKPQSSKAFVAALKKAGGNAEITEFEGADHFAVPKLTYCDENINLIDWLIGK